MRWGYDAPALVHKALSASIRLAIILVAPAVSFSIIDPSAAAGRILRVGVPNFVKVAGEPHALLPDDVYPCDAAELYDTLVKPFPKSRTRAEIWAGFQELVRQPVLSFIGVSLWIDGSFVTGKLNPNDVDVVAFAKADVLNQLTPASRSKLRRLQDPAWTQARFRTHFFVVSIYPMEDKGGVVSEGLRCYWRKWWGETRGGTRKGFVSMIAGNPSNVPTVDVTRCE